MESTALYSITSTAPSASSKAMNAGKSRWVEEEEEEVEEGEVVEEEEEEEEAGSWVKRWRREE